MFNFILYSFLISFNLNALVKVENVRQGVAGKGRGLVRVNLSNPVELSKVELSYGQDFVELIIPEAFIIPASKRVFNPSSARSSVLRIEAEMLKGTRVSVKIFYRLAIDIVKSTAELKQEKNDIVFYYSTVKDEKTVLKADKDTSSIELKSTEFIEPNIIQEASKSELVTSKNNITDKTDKESFKANKFESKEASISLFWSFIKMLMVLVFIIAIFLIGVYFFKKYFKGSLALYGKKLIDPNIKILGSLSLEFGKTIYIVKIASETHLIGCSKDRLTYLNKLSEEIKIEDEQMPERSNQLSTYDASESLKTRLKDRLREKKKL